MFALLLLLARRRGPAPTMRQWRIAMGLWAIAGGLLVTLAVVLIAKA
jgi:hypothetical protein